MRQPFRLVKDLLEGSTTCIGVVHGDLSPNNVLVDRTDLTVNIIDFETVASRW